MTPDTLPIRASDKLHSLFARDERLIDVVASHSPKLAKLRNSPMRHTMSRVTTVAQAAQLCGIPASTLVRDLNHAIGIESPPADAASAEPPGCSDEIEVPPPALFEHAVLLDVREQLSSGGEPFSRIMAAVAALGDGEVLHLRAPFEPVPLFGVMDKRGFSHRVERHADDDWSVWFYRQRDSAGRKSAGAALDADSRESTVADAPAVVGPARTEVRAEVRAEVRIEVRIDVRDLEPPEPLLRTLEALESLPPDSVLMHINVRVPQLLLPILRERGFAFSIDESRADEVRVAIWRAE